jgi:hypothetical protein
MNKKKKNESNISTMHDMFAGQEKARRNNGLCVHFKRSSSQQLATRLTQARTCRAVDNVVDTLVTFFKKSHQNLGQILNNETIAFCEATQPL